MKKFGVRGGALALAGVLCLAVGSVSAAADEEAVPVVSHGVQVLAAQTDMAISAQVGNDAVFSSEVFRRALNLSRLDYITLSSVPAANEGELLLGSSRIAAGQTISAENLSYMVFHPAAEDVLHGSFTFTANGVGTVMLCNVYLLSEANYTPTVAMAPALSLNMSTHKDMAAHGLLSGYDPDGDGLLFEVVSYPQNGSVRLEDSARGSYVYTPARGFTGVDSFSYVVRDKYGNYSATATVNMQVTLSGSSVTYVDMENSPAYNAALRVTAEGIMSGTQVGNQSYFYPDEGVTRADFLVMAMHAAGITDVPDAKSTVFADDAEIPESMKGHVATAYELGYISGSLENGKLCFLPDEEITRAQAAVMLSNIVGLCDVAVTPTFADNSQIPVWAKEAIYSLNTAGIMNTEDGYIAPTSAITRAQTAQMLAAVMQYVE